METAFFFSWDWLKLSPQLGISEATTPPPQDGLL